VASLLASALLLRGAVVELPADHLLRPRSYGRSPAWRVALGALLLVGGLLMLVLPGQGVLTMLMGVMLLGLPCTRRLELRLLRRPRILAAANALRRRAGKEPFVLPAGETGDAARG
jgi:UPF0716 family protein affecting phage T7 exclusion